MAALNFRSCTKEICPLLTLEDKPFLVAYKACNIFSRYTPVTTVPSGLHNWFQLPPTHPSSKYNENRKFGFNTVRKQSLITE